MIDLRIGHGYDVHRLVEGRPLILGGVTIPYERGLLGHSDADVLAHAVMDALLGAAALGDIGGMFPDSDERWRDADSLHLLEQVAARLAETGWEIGNVDATVLAQAPKLAPYIPEMRRRMANAMGIDAAQVSVKATTEEHLGFTGAGEGMACHAVGGGDGFPVPQSGGSAVRCGGPCMRGVHIQRHPWAEHRHQNVGEARMPRGHLRL